MILVTAGEVHPAKDRLHSGEQARLPFVWLQSVHPPVHLQPAQWSGLASPGLRLSPRQSGTGGGGALQVSLVVTGTRNFLSFLLS